MAFENPDESQDYDAEDYFPDVDAAPERRLVIKQLQDTFAETASVAAYTMNPQFDTVTVLAGQVDPHEQADGGILYEHTYLMLVRQHTEGQPADMATVLIFYDDRSMERIDYALEYADDTAPFLSRETYNTDSDIRYFLDRTTYGLQSAINFLDYMRVNQIPDIYDIAMRVREVDGPEVQRPPAAA